VPVTIRDVAREAGVSVGTVSRVMNDSAQVSPHTRAQVLDVVAALGYQPNQSGRALARGRLPTVAVIVPFVTHPSAIARIRGLVDGFRRVGHPVSIFDVEMPEHADEHLLTLTSGLRPEGAVIVSLPMSAPRVATLADAGLRPVLVDAEADGLSSVVIDDVAGGALATAHLTELGHRRVAFLGDREPDGFGFVSSVRRHEGYREALAAAGVTPEPAYERTAPHGRETACEQTRALLALPEPPTAVFAASDTQALGVLDAAAARGLRVPEDLSVVGFDDIDVAAHAGLTTVRQPLFESGLAAARILQAEVEEASRAPERLVLPVELVTRRTTAPPGSPARSARREDTPA
jgi:LacI family transcriptional regulator